MDGPSGAGGYALLWSGGLSLRVANLAGRRLPPPRRLAMPGAVQPLPGSDRLLGRRLQRSGPGRRLLSGRRLPPAHLAAVSGSARRLLGRWRILLPDSL